MKRLKKEIIILDIDRTLVHSIPNLIYQQMLKHDTITFNNETIIIKEWIQSFKIINWDNYYVVIRPYLDILFDYFKNNNISFAIFTSAGKEYAEFISNYIEINYNCKPMFIFSLIEANESIIRFGKPKTKAYIMYKFPDLDINNVILVDDSKQIKTANGDFCYLIPQFCICDDFIHQIVPYMKDDNELLNLINYLKQ